MLLDNQVERRGAGAQPGQRPGQIAVQNSRISEFIAATA